MLDVFQAYLKFGLKCHFLCYITCMLQVYSYPACTLTMSLFVRQSAERPFQAAQNEKDASGDVIMDIANANVTSTADDTCTTVCTESSPSFRNSTITVAGCTLQITVCLYLWTNTTQSLNISTRHHRICSDNPKKELGCSRWLRALSVSHCNVNLCVS